MSILVWFAAGLLVIAALAVLAGARRMALQHVWWAALVTILTATLLTAAAVPLHGRMATWRWPMAGGLSLRWQLDAQTWPWAMTALVMLLALSLADAVRSARGAGEGSGWAGVLLAGAVAVPAVLAASPWTLATGWALLDLAVLAADLGRFERPLRRSGVVWAAFGRAATWLAAGVVAVLLPHRPQEAMLLWFVALALRLLLAALEPGVVPSDRPPWRLAWGAVHLLSVLAAAGWAANQTWVAPPALLNALGIMALWGTWRWQRTRAALWQLAGSGVAFGGVALMAAARGLPAATWAWGILAVFPVLGVMMAPNRRRMMWPFLALLAGGLVLWPFTPASAAVALWQPPFQGWMLFPWLVLAGNMAAVVMQLLTLPASAEPLPREQQAFSVLAMTVWVVAFWGWQFWPVASQADVALWQQWVPGAAALAAAVVAWQISRRIDLRITYAETLVRRGTAQLAGRAFWAVYRLMGRFLRFFSLLLEGDGGVLWALVLLVMLAVLLQR